MMGCVDRNEYFELYQGLPFIMLKSSSLCRLEFGGLLISHSYIYLHYIPLELHLIVCELCSSLFLVVI